MNNRIETFQGNKIETFQGNKIQTFQGNKIQTFQGCYDINIGFVWTDSPSDNNSWKSVEAKE
jgi:hypothetical protein